MKTLKCLFYAVAAVSIMLSCGGSGSEETVKAAAPVLQSTVPADGAVDVALNTSEIVLTYDQNIKVLTADQSKITLDGGASVTKVNAYSKTLTLSISGLSYGTKYTLGVPAGVVSGYKENQESTVAVNLSFTTEKEPEDPGTDERLSDVAWNLAAKLRLGWNMGNQMDATSGNMPSETAWGNPKCTQETFTNLKKAGFTSVRIPITWLEKIGAAPDYKIDEEWMARVAEIVGYAETAGLYAIINTHHDECNNDGRWLDLLKASRDAEFNAATKAKIKAVWTQIANRFKDKGDWLIMESFNELQELHRPWKEIGPVPDDKKEEIWERFKTASDQINQRRREHYDKLFAEEQNNYNAKVVLCEQAEEIVAQPVEQVSEYNAVSDKLTELFTLWKTLGPAPAKLNDEIWNRFKSTLDKFFQQKKEHFQQIKDTQMQNYNQKLNLAIQAEGIADRTDWKQATNEILALQTEWKSIGATPRKYSDQVWKRFRAACDKFFEAKAKFFSNVEGEESENLRKKEELIQQILGYEFGEDRNANLDAMKAFQKEWLEIGFVPRADKDRIYTEYREAINKRFAELKVNADEMRQNRFQSRINDIMRNPNADKLIDREKNNLTTRLARLKDDIVLWENNLGFFSNSKNAEILTAEFRKKIEAAKKEVVDLEYKIKMMNNPKAAEEAEAPAAEAEPDAETEKPAEA